MYIFFFEDLKGVHQIRANQVNPTALSTLSHFCRNESFLKILNSERSFLVNFIFCCCCWLATLGVINR